MDTHQVYLHGVRTEPQVALTFDDGPNPPRTEQVLEILAAAQARATFFLMAKWAERFPRSVERILAAGHLVGNHGYSGQGWIGDYDQAEAVIGHLTGKPSRYLRPHTYNFAAYFESRVSRLALSYTVACDVDSKDWETAEPEAIVANVLDHPGLGPGSIINLHDGAEYEEAAIRLHRPVSMLLALPRIIEGLKARGLTCVRLDEMALATPVTWLPGERLSDLQRKAR